MRLETRGIFERVWEVAANKWVRAPHDPKMREWFSKLINCYDFYDI
jgi:hypothetical protein